jgi:hypothetical protein
MEVHPRSWRRTRSSAAGRVVAHGRSTEVTLGLASEGSFGPHPAVPWITVDREIVVLVDDRRGLVVVGVASSTDIVAASMTLRPSQDLAPLVERADLPTHAVTVVPNQGPPARSTRASAEPRTSRRR